MNSISPRSRKSKSISLLLITAGSKKIVQFQCSQANNPIVFGHACITEFLNKRIKGDVQLNKNTSTTLSTQPTLKRSYNTFCLKKKKSYHHLLSNILKICWYKIVPSKYLLNSFPYLFLERVQNHTVMLRIQEFCLILRKSLVNPKTG